MPRNILEFWKTSSQIKVLAACAIAGVLAAAYAGWLFSHSAGPIVDAATQPAVAAQALGAADAPVSAAATPPPVIAQQASVASIIEVVVGRNDTLDAIFRRMSLNKADLAAIRNLPGIRQSLDFLKPGDAIKLTHTDGDIQELSARSARLKPSTSCARTMDSRRR